MKIKKSICTILSIVFALTMSIPTLAAEEVASDSIDSNTFYMTRSQMTAEQQERYDNYLQSQMQGDFDAMQVGETRVVLQDEEGTLNVTLTESHMSQDPKASTQTTTKTFQFTDTNTLGNTNVVFKIDLSCSWMKDGTNSKINKLNASYTNYNTNKFTLAWESTSATDVSAVAWLRVTKLSASPVSLGFAAWCHQTASPYISFDIL